MVLRLVKASLSRQAEYLLTSSTEGNTIGKVVKRLGKCGCLVEFGRTIRIIRRMLAKKIVSPDNLIATFNLRGILKPKGNQNVQVVLLFWLSSTYQSCLQRNLKR